MNNISVEVCVDSVESLNNAVTGGASRIELCSSLPLGGISPTYGLISYALKNINIPVYAMIRPRSGDFLFTADEISMMCDEIQFLREIGIKGVVIGALTIEANINTKAIKRWLDSADGMGVTFHRAFDLVQNSYSELETLIDLGCERVLTSGGSIDALLGAQCLKKLVEQADNRISIMAGCGINRSNAKKIVELTGVSEIHLSGKVAQPSKMNNLGGNVAMGNNLENDCFQDVTDPQIIKDIVIGLNEI